MANFTSFLDILPDPGTKIGDGGQELTGVSGSPGPGFASVKLSSEHKISNNRTNSGKVLSIQTGGHQWNIEITYNPMLRSEFEPIHNFLIQKRGQLSPFFVKLPQYQEPQDSTFATFVESNVFDTSAIAYAGETSMDIEHASYDSSEDGTCKPGDLFTVEDSNDITHNKVYQITRVETKDNCLNSSVNVLTKQKIHFTPALQKTVPSGTDIGLTNVKFRVILKNNIQEYNLNTENLYSFSLALEEAQR